MARLAQLLATVLLPLLVGFGTGVAVGSGQFVEGFGGAMLLSTAIAVADGRIFVATIWRGAWHSVRAHRHLSPGCASAQQLRRQVAER